MVNQWIVIALSILTYFRGCDGKAIDQSSSDALRHTMNPYSTNTEEVEQRIIDLNQALPDDVTQFLNGFQLSVDELKRRQDKFNASRSGSQDSSGLDAMATTEMNKFSTPDDEFKNMKKELVRKTIENLRNSSRPNNGESHQLPAYVPNCDAIPTVLSENEWFGKTPNTQYTWNLFFYPRDLRKDTVVDVMMRIFKKPDDTEDQEIATQSLDEYYTIKLSVYKRKVVNDTDLKLYPHVKIISKAGKKNTILQKIEIGRASKAKNFCGWVEFNVASLRSHWHQQKNNLGIAVDLFDHNDKQLNARNHFSLQSCEEGLLYPWEINSILHTESSICNSRDKTGLYQDARIDLTLSSLSSKQKRHVRNIRNHKGHLRHHLLSHKSER